MTSHGHQTPDLLILSNILSTPPQKKKKKKKKKTIHQVTTLLATSKDILFPGHNQLLTTSADDLALDHLHWRSANHQSEGSSAPVVSRWLAWWLPGGWCVFFA